MTYVKGTAVKFIPKIVKKKYGKEGYKRWLESLSPGALNIYNSNIDTNEWYHIKEALVEPMANFCMLFYNWDFKGAWEIGKFSADFGLTTTFKFSLKRGSAESLITKAVEILSDHYKPSIITIAELKEFNATLQITNFPDLNKIVEHSICGWIERALEISGCSDILVEVTASIENLKSYTEIKASWKKK